MTCYWGNFKLTAPPVGQFRVSGGAIHKWGNFQPYPIDIAAWKGNFDIVKFIFGKLDENDLPSFEGFTPIDAAVGRIRRKRVKNFAEEFFDTAKP